MKVLLDGVQSKVKDGTLLWSETPGFLSYHVVLEFGKMTQLLGSSEDQLGALGREGIGQKQRTPNSIRKCGARQGRQPEEVEGECPYRLVSEWG